MSATSEQLLLEKVLTNVYTSVDSGWTHTYLSGEVFGENQ